MNRDAALSAYLAEKGRELEYRKSVIEKEKAAKQTESLKEVSKREYEHENEEESTAVKKLCLRNSDDIKEEVSTSDSEFCSNQTEGSIQNGNTRKTSSCQNVWDGVALVTNTCFDSFTGALLSKEECKVRDRGLSRE
uniref:Uncharacterized protein n=1 Tax=Caenorhabditis japonica TaxID=281687 RepID=A0A8R1HR72_CAEJA